MKMKNWLVLGIIFIASTAFAQVIVPPTSTELLGFITAIGGLKGASAMAIAAFAVQGLMLLFRSSLGTKAGIYQILAVNGLTLVAGVIALMISGQTFLQALLNSQTLAMTQVFIHQIMTQAGKGTAPQNG